MRQDLEIVKSLYDAGSSGSHSLEDHSQIPDIRNKVEVILGRKGFCCSQQTCAILGRKQILTLVGVLVPM